MNVDMEESQTAAPFLTKTYEMVDDPITNPLVSWSESGRSFVVWNPLEFARDLLPVYFKHNNFSSFVRQLNTYGFKKIDAERWEFANEGFVRGKRYTLKTIKRQKPIHSHSSTKTNQQQHSSSRESERQVLEGRIQRLKRDKNLLKLEVQRRGSQNHASKLQVESLTERLRKLEHRQMQLMNFFTQLLNKPSAQLAVYSTNKKRRLILFDMIGSGGSSTSTSTSKDNSGRLSEEMIEKMEASLNYWLALVYSSGETFVEKVHDLGVVPQLSVEETEQEEEEEEEANGGSGGGGGGTTRASSPTPQTLKDSSSTSTTSVGVNDVFWEQFFTETPNPTTTTPS